MNPPENTSSLPPRDHKERVIQKTKPQPCDKAVSLYVLNTEKTVFQKTFDGCERPFVAIPVVNSNLVLVVMDTLCTLAHYSRTTLPLDVMYNETLACFKSRYGTLSRRSFSKCISAHEKEEAIELCGDGHRIQHEQSALLGLLLALLTVLGHFQLVRIHDDH